MSGPVVAPLGVRHMPGCSVAVSVRTALLYREMCHSDNHRKLRGSWLRERRIEDRRWRVEDGESYDSPSSTLYLPSSIFKAIPSARHDLCYTTSAYFTK